MSDQGPPSRGPREEASELLHHLLNQSLSGLDFCILWQSLAASAPELEAVDRLVRQFLETADLGALDRALALLPEPVAPPTRGSLSAPPAEWQRGWEVRSRRARDVTRVEFRCQSCQWVFDFTQEHPPNTELRLPFDELVCPCCQP